MELSELFGILILIIERITEIVKAILENFNIQLSDRSKKIVSIIVGAGVGYVLLSTSLIQMVGNVEPFSFYEGILYGIIASLPANLVHSILKWIENIKIILDQKNKG